MRFSPTIKIWVAIAVVSVIAHGELVRDWRTPDSGQSVRYAMSVTRGILTADLKRLEVAMKEKYGARTETALHVDTGSTDVTLDGKLLEAHPELTSIDSVYGIFVFGPDNDLTMKFPFEVFADRVQASSNKWIEERLRSTFQGAPPAWFEFNESDWTFDRCIAQPRNLGLGVVGSALFLRGGTSCVVSWKGKQPSTMLISVSVANGDPWMRPFVRRVCRAITESELSQFNPKQPDSPKYAACLLIDRPAYGNARQSLSVDLYSVEAGNKLARIEK